MVPEGRDSARKLDITGQPQARTARLANRAGTLSARRGRDARQACKGNRLRPKRKLARCRTVAIPQGMRTGRRPDRPRSGSCDVSCCLTWLQVGARWRHGSSHPIAVGLRTHDRTESLANRHLRDGQGNEGQARPTMATSNKAVLARGRSDSVGQTPRTPPGWNIPGRQGRQGAKRTGSREISKRILDVLNHPWRDRCRQRQRSGRGSNRGMGTAMGTSLPARASKGKGTPGRLVVSRSLDRQLSPTSDEVGRTQRMAHRQIGLTALSVQAKNGTPGQKRSQLQLSEGQPDTTLRSWPVPYAGRNPRGRTPGNRTS